MDCNEKIKCSVDECHYHHGKYTCTARTIEVGNCKPTTTRCDDTLCGTFRVREESYPDVQ